MRSATAAPSCATRTANFRSISTPRFSTVGDLLGRYALPPDIKQDEDWQAVAQNAEAWLNEIVKSLKAAAAAKTDLVTLYLSAPEHYSSYRDELADEAIEDFSFVGKLKSFIGRYI